MDIFIISMKNAQCSLMWSQAKPLSRMDSSFLGAQWLMMPEHTAYAHQCLYPIELRKAQNVRQMHINIWPILCLCNACLLHLCLETACSLLIIPSPSGCTLESAMKTTLVTWLQKTRRACAPYLGTGSIKSFLTDDSLYGSKQLDVTQVHVTIKKKCEKEVTNLKHHFSTLLVVLC